MKTSKSEILKLIESEKKDSIWNHFLNVFSMDSKTNGEILGDKIKIWTQDIWIRSFYPIFIFEFNSENELVKVSDKLNPFGRILFMMLPITYFIIAISKLKYSIIPLIIALIFIFVYFLICRKIYRFEKNELLKYLMER